MATEEEDISAVQLKFSNLSTKGDNSSEIDKTVGSNDTRGSHLSGFDTRELYKIALNFYKEKEGKAVHLSYEDKCKLVAYTQQVTHGKCTPENAPPLGVLDVIGKDRRTAWQNLGEISRDEAMEGFVVLLDKLCPLFKTFVEAKKMDNEEKLRLKEQEEQLQIEERKRQRALEAARKKEEEARLKEELQRQQIQDALNQQTYYQFKAYAEQQYPGNPEQQGVLIRQLQEQHYHQYMQQLHQNQVVISESECEKKPDIVPINADGKIEKLDVNESAQVNEDDLEDDTPDWPPIARPEMWVRKEIDEFKETIMKVAGDSVFKVGHGEILTVRVPTHEDGTCLFWEFATDDYDIGFGVYFEWTKPETNQVSVHVSESEDEDEDYYEYESKQDLESGGDEGTGQSDYDKPATPPISVIVPVFRRDSQEEVYAGSHQYPGEGVYLLKFDNSYSLWRSKTLYYRVYYTKKSDSSPN